MTAAPTTTDTPLTLHSGEPLTEREFHLACAARFDEWILRWTAAGLDAQVLVAELRVALTQALIYHQRQAEGAAQ